MQLQTCCQALHLLSPIVLFKRHVAEIKFPLFLQWENFFLHCDVPCTQHTVYTKFVWGAPVSYSSCFLWGIIWPSLHAIGLSGLPKHAADQQVQQSAFML